MLQYLYYYYIPTKLVFVLFEMKVIVVYQLPRIIVGQRELGCYLS